jgi:uncharacterized membrane protein
MYSIYQVFWLFLIYSVVGWVIEVAFVTLTTGHFVNRGFLNGPACPIYGFGMLGVLFALEPVSGNVLCLFLGGMVLCTAVECFGGWALDKLFHMRWWDYSDKPFNFHGYVCLGYSVMWGIGVVLIVRVLHPLIFGAVRMVPQKVGMVPMVICYVGFAVDLVVSLKTVIGISKNLGELERIAKGLHQLGDEMSSLVGTAVIDTTEKLSEEREEFSQRTAQLAEKFSEEREEHSQKTAQMAEKNREERAQRRAELQEKITQLEERSLTLQKRISGNRRILRAFPGLRRSSSRIRLTEELLKLRERHKKEDGGEKHAEIL